MANLATKPIIFTARGFEADVRLHVLDKAVFHVHSAILKLNSTFFFKFLDSPDKANAVAVPGGLKYEWITKVDDDGTWSLVAAVDGKIKNQNMNKLRGEVDFQLGVFEQFLRALYHKTYEVVNFDSLSLLVQFADYYRALPTISASITGAIFKLTRLNPEWHSLAPSLINHAYKLRHKDLFRDCAIYMAGRRGARQYLWEEEIECLEPAIMICIDTISNRIDAMIGKAHTRIMSLARVDLKFSAIMEMYPKGYLPAYYRNMYEDCGEETIKVEFYLEDLLENNLWYDWKGAVSGKGKFEDFFLCGWICDEDIPWNLEEEDW